MKDADFPKIKLFIESLPRGGSTLVGTYLAAKFQMYNAGESFYLHDETVVCSCGEVTCGTIAALKVMIEQNDSQFNTDAKILKIGEYLGYLDCWLEPNKERHAKSLGGLKIDEITEQEVFKNLEKAAKATDELAEIYYNLIKKPIIDNSKYAELGRLLEQKYNWLSIGLVRSPFGLAYSNRRVEERKNVSRPIKSKLEIYKHHARKMLEKKLSGGLVISYERFCKSPEQILEEVKSYIEGKTKIQITDLQAQENQSVHVLGGNRWLFENKGNTPAEIKEDNEWILKLPLQDIQTILADRELVNLYSQLGYDLEKEANEAEKLRAISSVLSFDEQKIQLQNNQIIKNSKPEEIAQITQTNEYLKANPIVLNGGVKVEVVPHQIDHKDKKIHMPVAGINLEFLLKSDYENNAKRFLPLLKEFFADMQKIGFLWGEIAPRNIIWNENENKFYLVDFERSSKFLNRAASSEEFCAHLAGYALEEFAGQILVDDCQNLFEDYSFGETGLSVENSISIEQISSKRRRELIRNFFPKNNGFISPADINQINRLVANSSLPFKLENQAIYYPIVKLDEAASKFGPKIYAEILISIYQMKSEGSNPGKIANFLDNCIQQKDLNFVVVSTGQNRYLCSEKLDLMIRLKNFTPRSGLILNEYFIQNPDRVKDKTILDIGTGEPGTVAQTVHKLGAKVTGVDIDPGAIDHAKESSQEAKKGEITFYVSDLFANVQGKFDVIISNPPQMPSTDPNGHVHDVSGIDGREAIKKILEDAANYLNEKGELYLLVFDFLGVDNNLGSDKPSLKKLGEICGFSGFEIVHTSQREVRKGGETEKNLEHILTQYPKYAFKSGNNDKKYHQIYIVKFTKGI